MIGFINACSFTSLARKSSTPTSLTNQLPEIHVAVCIQRLPILTREKTELEMQYEELQEQLELEHSSLSDYEVNEINVHSLQEKLKNDEDNESLKKEAAELDSKYQVN